jgi:hypothetical protein
MVLLATLSIFIAAYCHAHDDPIGTVFWIAVAAWAVYSEAKRQAR